MSTVAGAIATVHAPLIVGMPGLAPPDKRAAVDAGFARLREVVEAATPDVIVSVSSEHITNFLSDDAPDFCVSLGDGNPVQPEFGLPELRIPSDAAFAKGLAEHAEAEGFELETRGELRLDHGTNLPLSYLTPHYDVPVVPIIINTVWSPFAPAARSWELGRLLVRYVQGDDAGRRVLLLGTGGISHWVGNPNHGNMNEEFDRWFLERIAVGDHETLRDLTDERIDEGGDGAHEVRTWVAMASAGAAAGLSPSVVLDETFVPGWNVSVYQVAWT